MLQIVIRFSIVRPRIASPVYSSTWPIPPATPSRPIAPRIMSFAVTLAGSSPSKRTRIERGRVWGRHCVASTCSTSDVPTPNASAPKAPWVAVWLSPQTIVIPGCVSPSSGPITWTIPSRPLPVAKSRTPNSSQLARNASSCALASGSVTGPSSVGTLWSIVAIDRSGRRTLLPASRRPSKAWGDVTSWIRCRSTKSRAGSPSGSATRCRSQIRSNRVFAIDSCYRAVL